jgi:predicted DNA-binding transcriptional regulator YafY
VKKLSIILRLQAGVTPELVRWLSYYGDQVIIKKPDSLKQAVLEEHLKAIYINGVM